MLSLVLAAQLTTGGALHSAGTAWAPSVNWVRIVNDPARFNDKRVCVKGWLTVHLTDDDASFVLWLTEEALRYRDTTAAIVIESSSISKLLPQPRRYWQDFNHEYVQLWGRFVAGDPENGEMVGTLKEIERVDQTKPGSPQYPTKR